MDKDDIKILEFKSDLFIVKFLNQSELICITTNSCNILNI